MCSSLKLGKTSGHKDDLYQGVWCRIGHPDQHDHLKGLVDGHQPQFCRGLYTYSYK